MTARQPPDKDEHRPAGEPDGAQDAHGGGITITVSDRRPGCPCGCRTWLPWIDDPDCLRHQPIRAAQPCHGGEFAGLTWIPCRCRGAA